MWAFDLLLEYRTSPGWVIIAVFASICSGLLPLLFSYYFGRILDILSSVETQDSALNFNCGMCLLSGILCIFTTWLSQFCFQLAAETTCNEWRRSLIRHTVRQDLSYFVRFPPAAINSALVDESQKMLMGMGQKMAMTLEFLSCFCGSVVISFCRSPLLSAVMIAISPLLLASGGILSNHVERITEQHTAQLSKLAEVAGDYLSNLRLVKVLNAEQIILHLFQDFTSASASNAVRRGLIIGSLIGMVDFCVFCSYSVGMWYGGKLIVDERVDNFTGLPTTGGDVICVFNSLVWGFYGLGQAMGSWTFLQAATAALQTFYDCVNAGKPSAMNTPDHSRPQRTLMSQIEFRSVSFKYDESGRQILDNVSFKINKGELVAICGESGCGKSTLQSMLLRLWKPTNGSIFVDGFDLNDFSAYDFDAMVACVCQEPGLFSISVVDNLTCMNENIPFKDVVQTCKTLGLHDLIQQMPKKYDTILDPAKLSGGQKQRFALVRAIVRKTPVIIMDEPFSALDNENEKLVYSMLEQLSVTEKVTIVFVTHRLINMKASKVVMMQNGSIDRIGSIDSLVSEGGYFFNLLAANVGQTFVDATHNNDLSTSDAPIISSNDAVKRRSSIIKSGYLGRMFASTLTIPDAPIGGYIFDNLDDDDGTTTLESLWSLFQQFGSDQKASVLVGFLAAIMNGLSFPLFSVIIGSTLNVMLQNDKQVISDSLPRASMIFFGLGVFSLIINVLQKFCCSLVAENFGNKLRLALFSNYLSVQLELMDSNSRHVMIDDMVQGIEFLKVSVTDKIAMYTQICVLGVTSLIISVLFGWQLTLALIFLTPIAFVAAWIDSKFVNPLSNECMEMNQKCNEMFAQITQNLMTILTIPSEGFIAKYDELIEAKTAITRKRIFFSSLSLALSNAVQFVIYASSLWLGCWFVRIGLCEKEAVLNVFMILSIAGMGITQLFQNTSDDLFLKQYVAHIKKRLDDGNRFEITIDDDASENCNQSVETNKSDDEANSDIHFSNVSMKYKSARAAVLNKISFTIAANSVTAFVGESGCGKSSIVSALLRLYDISDGQICLGGQNITKQPTAWVRDQISIVQQESSLFDESILKNFQIAAPSCSDTQIWESLESSGAKEFVELLPEKLHFKVGHNGSKLSGGQKQRISIAISILQLSIKNILILDEASSALDAFAEKALLECIQTFRGKKTIVIIAHTPALLNVCDAVILVKNGKVIESSK